VEQTDALLLVRFDALEAEAIFQPLGGMGVGMGALEVGSH